MNRDAREAADIRNGLPPVGKPYLLVGMLATALCALAFACVGDERVALIVLGVLFLYTVMLVRLPRAVTPILLIAVLATVLGGSLSVGALVLSAIVGTGTLAWLFTAWKSPLPPLALLLGVFALSWGITGDRNCALLAFSFLPAAFFLALATLRSLSRTSAICYAQIGWLLTAAAILISFLYQFYGAVNADVVARAAEDLRATLLGGLSARREELILIARESGGENAAALMEELKTTLSDSNLRVVVSYAVNLLPGVLAVVAGVIAYYAQTLVCALYFRTGRRQLLTPEMCAFTMSALSAVLYILSFFLSFFVSSETLFGALMQNVYLILLPGFCVVGIAVLSAAFRMARGGARLFILLLVASLLCCGGATVLSFLAAWGAYSTVMARLHKRLADRGNGDDRD